MRLLDLLVWDALVSFGYVGTFFSESSRHVVLNFCFAECVYFSFRCVERDPRPELRTFFQTLL